ncbi:di-heme oxidoredictase family protein [Arenibacter algicola]|uniref:Di-heme oxidoreductase, putative peroxidase n=1 Tax=Arenibacter algicola TaxID=616991 RepID=A0A221UXM1_9FLAO|nr:di-heme oxidoredictase family protein [Arenibacter algicola]ASO05866.1 di-heme oxidoreductase, putative peroxidase [Arenibacter algicola]
MSKITFVFVGLSVILFCGCENLGPEEPMEFDLLDGPIDGLSISEQKRFLAGDIAFNDDVFTVENGLGPLFVGTSCVSCHSGDGKGHPFNQLIRFGNNDLDLSAMPTIGDGRNQIQNKAIPGFEPETPPHGVPFSILVAPAVTGLGLLDAVPDEEIVALADPMDEDGDGISGRPHYNLTPEFTKIRENSVPQGDNYIFRFGKKANSYDLLHQTVGAYNQDIGITSLFDPIDPFSGLEVDSEISTKTLNDVVFYLKTLKAPISRNQMDPDVIAGKELFQSVQCAACHTPTLTTGYSPIKSLSFKEFHSYTDLLLHDMGPGLDDGFTEGNVETSEWRTPPLWGIGLSANSQGGQMFLLHDGRASSIEEAIEMHGGEANNSKARYLSLAPEEKSQLIKFINSL